MKITYIILTVVTLLVPDCLLAGPFSIFGKVDEALKHRNEVEDHWENQYRAHSHSEMERSYHQYERWESLYVGSEGIGRRRKRDKSRQTSESREAYR